MASSWADLFGGSTQDRNKGHSDAVQCLHVVDDFMYTGSSDNTIMQWNLKTDVCTHVFRGHDAPVYCLQLEDGVLYSGSGDATVRAWNVETGQCVHVYEGHTKWVQCLQVVGETLFSGSFDQTIRAWNVKTGACEELYAGHTDWITSLHFFSGILFSGSWDHSIRAWNVQNWECLHVHEGHSEPVFALCVSKGRMYSGARDKTVRAWDFETGECVQLYAGHKHAITAIQVDDNYLYSGSYDKAITMFDLKSGDNVRQFIGHDDTVFCLQIVGQYLFSGSDDHTIRKWDIETGRCLHIYGASSSASPFVSSEPVPDRKAERAVLRQKKKAKAEVSSRLRQVLEMEISEVAIVEGELAEQEEALKSEIAKERKARSAVMGHSEDSSQELVMTIEGDERIASARAEAQKKVAKIKKKYQMHTTELRDELLSKAERARLDEEDDSQYLEEFGEGQKATFLKLVEEEQEQVSVVKKRFAKKHEALRDRMTKEREKRVAALGDLDEEENSRLMQLEETAYHDLLAQERQEIDEARGATRKKKSALRQSVQLAQEVATSPEGELELLTKREDDLLRALIEEEEEGHVAISAAFEKKRAGIRQAYSQERMRREAAGLALDDDEETKHRQDRDRQIKLASEEEVAAHSQLEAEFAEKRAKVRAENVKKKMSIVSRQMQNAKVELAESGAEHPEEEAKQLEELKQAKAKLARKKMQVLESFQEEAQSISEEQRKKNEEHLKEMEELKRRQEEEELQLQEELKQAKERADKQLVKERKVRGKAKTAGVEGEDEALAAEEEALLQAQQEVEKTESSIAKRIREAAQAKLEAEKAEQERLAAEAKLIEEKAEAERVAKEELAREEAELEAQLTVEEEKVKRTGKTRAAKAQKASFQLRSAEERMATIEAEESQRLVEKEEELRKQVVKEREVAEKKAREKREAEIRMETEQAAELEKEAQRIAKKREKKVREKEQKTRDREGGYNATTEAEAEFEKALSTTEKKARGSLMGKRRKMSALAIEKGLEDAPEEYILKLEEALTSDFSDIEALGLVHFVDNDYKGRPVAIVSGAKFPATREAAFLDRVYKYIIKYMDEVSNDKYVVVFDNTGTATANRPDFGLIKGWYEILPRKYRKNLAALYILRASFWLRSLTWFMKPIVSEKFWAKLHYIADAGELRNVLDFVEANLPPDVLDTTLDEGAGAAPKPRSFFQEQEKEKKQELEFQEIAEKTAVEDFKDIKALQCISLAGHDLMGRPCLQVVAKNFPANSGEEFLERMFRYFISLINDTAKRDYVVLFVNTNTTLDNRPNVAWLQTCAGKLPHRFKKNLKKFYVLHPTMWIKSMSWLIRPFVNPKFARKLVYIDNIVELAGYFDLNKVALPQDVVAHIPIGGDASALSDLVMGTSSAQQVANERYEAQVARTREKAAIREARRASRAPDADSSSESESEDDEEVVPPPSNDFSDMKLLNCVFQSGIDNEGRPVLVFVGKNLPAFRGDAFMNRFYQFLLHTMEPIADRPYTVIYCNTATKSEHRPDFGWIRNAYNNLDKKYRKNLKRMYIIHSSATMKAAAAFLKTFLSDKFWQKVVYLDNVNDLSDNFDLSKLHLPTDVLKYIPETGVEDMAQAKERVAAEEEKRKKEKSLQDLSDLEKADFIRVAGTDLMGRATVVVVGKNMVFDDKAYRVLAYLRKVMDSVVNQDYSLIYCNTHTKDHNRPDLTWLRETYNELPQSYKKNLKKVYIVHSTAGFKSAVWFLKTFVSHKFWKKVHYVDDVADLAENFDLSQISLPQEVVKHMKTGDKSKAIRAMSVQEQRKSLAVRREQQGQLFGSEEEEAVEKAKVVDTSDIASTNMFYMAGKDNKGRPVAVLLGKNFAANQGEAHLEKQFLYMLKQLDPHTQQEFVVVFCNTSTNASNRPEVAWFQQAYQSLPRRYKKNLKKVYILHSNFALKSLTWLTKTFVSEKFWKKVEHVDSVNDLAAHVDVPQLLLPDDITKGYR